MKAYTLTAVLPALAEIAQLHGLRLYIGREWRHACRIWANQYCNVPADETGA